MLGLFFLSYNPFAAGVRRRPHKRGGGGGGPADVISLMRGARALSRALPLGR